jgi:hypothetical protein
MADSAEMVPKAGSKQWLRRLNWNAGMKFFLCVLGMVMIIEGLPYFAAPEKMKYWVQKVVATPDSSLRRLGLVLMVIGLFMVFVGRT